MKHFEAVRDQSLACEKDCPTRSKDLGFLNVDPDCSRHLLGLPRCAFPAHPLGQ